jgi:tRNA(Ile)-lysidine synthase
LQPLYDALTAALTLPEIPPNAPVWVAYSGGLDSQSLLNAAVQLRNKKQIKSLHAIHIHHGLQSLADTWQQHCETYCTQHKVDLQVLHLNLVIESGQSLEAEARTARYQAINAALPAGAVLLVAQHANDQAETVLLQLARGAGPAGLAAMPVCSRSGAQYLLRPWLAFTRADLESYAQAENLTWIDDPSNADTRFARNFIRHNLLPQWQTQSLGLVKTLNRVAQQQAEALELQQALTALDLVQCLHEDARWFAPSLCIKALLSFSPLRQAHILRAWFKQQGCIAPNRARLENLQHMLCQSTADSDLLLAWSDVIVRRYRDDLYLMKHNTDPLKVVQYPCTAGQEGLATEQVNKIEIRYRQGGECWQWHGHQRDLKKIWQAAGIPAWLRDDYPLLYIGDELVAIPDIGVADAWCVKTENAVYFTLHSALSDT